ncbi:hypothetical protein DL546_005218 [Coniochaeta pulveracea]|uniref:Arrestin-like N-terminal domain-containing protein n=1 Tax=Coniochaeta pulveracea TaxID=177199 RepID=A0A420YI22_9PEZI|nr:hypothetical protein DL546_005218 [Coniochaeta pulveracea]
MAYDYAMLHRGRLAGAFPSSASASTSDGSGATSINKQPAIQRSNIEVKFHNHYRQKVYTSGSSVTGEVTITTKREVPFDSVQIVLVGNTKTRVDGINSPREVTHTFLKMTMPIPRSAYPVPRTLESGRTYTFPFHFVIPTYLTIGSCNHHIVDDQLPDHHVCLPPTMGKWEKDDMAPKMAQIEYSVKARIYRQPDLSQHKIKVMEASESFLVLPASAEHPPLNITKKDKLYKMRHSKTLRKGLLLGKLGRITAEAAQPQAAVLLPDGTSISKTETTIDLMFEPVALDVLPPKITAVSAKLIARTFYAGGSIAQLPNLGDWANQVGAEKRGDYQTSVTLPSLVAKKDTGRLARWSQHLSSAVRRDSGYSSGAEEEGRRGSNGSEQPSSPIYHTATLDVPIDMAPLLAKRTPIPTFHSCIASRVYTLQLTVSLNSGATTHAIHFSLPLQIVVAQDPSLALSDDGLPSFETAIQEAETEVDQFFRPRLMQVPEQSYIGNSSLPGYGDLVEMR